MARWEPTASRQGYIMDSPRRQQQALWRDNDPKRFAPKNVGNVYPRFLYQRSSHGDPLNQRDPRDFEPRQEDDRFDPRYVRDYDPRAPRDLSDICDPRDLRDPRDLNDPRAPRDLREHRELYDIRESRDPSPVQWQRAQLPADSRESSTEHWRPHPQHQEQSFASPRGGAPPQEQFLSPRGGGPPPGVNGPDFYYSPRAPPADVQVLRNEPAPAEKLRPFDQTRFHTSKGAYIFIWFATRRQENTDVVAHSCVLSKPETLGGRFVGIARKLDETALKFSGDEAIVVFLFKNSEEGRKFCEYDPRIRQPDFPPPSGICDIIPLLRHYNPENEALYRTFVLSEVLLNEGINVSEYKETFVKPFGDYLHENGAQPFVVQSFGYRFHRRQMPKNHFPPDNTIMVLHLFRDRFHYQALRDSPEYQRLKNKQGLMAWEVTTAFSIDPQACP